MNSSPLLAGLCFVLPLVATAQPTLKKPVAQPQRAPAGRPKIPDTLDSSFERLHQPTIARQKALGDTAGKMLATGSDITKVVSAKLAPELAKVDSQAAWKAVLDKQDAGLRKAIDLAGRADTPTNRKLLATAGGISTLATIRTGNVTLPGGETAIRGAQYRPRPDGGGEQKGRTGRGSSTSTSQNTPPPPPGPDVDGVVRINELWLGSTPQLASNAPTATATRGNRLDVVANVVGIGAKHHWHSRVEPFELTRAAMHRAEILFTRDTTFPNDRGTGFQNKAFTLGGYVNAEVTVSMQVFDGSAPVCSDTKSVDRRWMLLAGADWADQRVATWRLACDFKHAADRPAAPYLLVVRVDAWAGGGGVSPDNFASAAIQADVHAWIKPL
ncbi:MAG: hypothetical protein SFX73_28150 [Kofleriaceae bacterium]|nr:hypothetical protein [Kofleriaceae bacterium]